MLCLYFSNLSEEILEELGFKSLKEAIDYLQKKKAIRMRNLLEKIKSKLYVLKGTDICSPLEHLRDSIIN